MGNTEGEIKGPPPAYAIGRLDGIIDRRMMSGERLRMERAGSLVPVRVGPDMLPRLECGYVNWPETEQGGAPFDRSLKNIEAFLMAADVEVAFNDFTGKPTVRYCGQWRDIDDNVLTFLKMRMHEKCLNPSPDFLLNAITDIALRNRYHPVLDYIDNLPPWDGVPRLDTWLSTYGGAEDTELHRAYGRCHLMAAIARVRTPGCKKDEMLVLQGPGGMGKSTAIQVLAGGPDWFDDSLTADMGPKEMIEQTSGKWLCEYAELDGLGKKATSAVKATLSRQVDTARLAYGRLPTNRPRQFVTFGTTNHTAYLVDDTGNRRFWCVPVTCFEVEALRKDRDQLWAEASKRFNAGECYELPRHLWQVSLAASQEKALESPWFEKLESELEGRHGYVSTDSVFEFLGVPTDRQNRWVAAEVRGYMGRLGWEKGQHKCNGKNRRCYANMPKGRKGEWLSLGGPSTTPKAAPAVARGPD